MPTPDRHPLRRLCQVLGMTLFLGTVAFWAAKGAHTGWTQNRVPVKQTDEVTGIEYVTYDERFVPGVEFLAAGVGLAAGLLIVGLLFRRSPPPSSA